MEIIIAKIETILTDGICASNINVTIKYHEYKAERFRSLSKSKDSYLNLLQNDNSRGVWVAQSAEPPTSAQVMISRLVSSSPALGSVLMARSLEPASESVSPSLSAPPLLVLSLKNKKIKNIKNLQGTWVAQSDKRLTSAQVTISRFVGLSPVSGCASSWEPGARFGFCVLLSLRPTPACALPLCLSKINKH